MSEQKKLLIVEDSKDIQELLQQLFEGENYKVESALNGQDALDTLAKCETLPNLILLDLMMPVMNGFEFRKHQQNDKRVADIPVVVMTAHGDALGKSREIGAKRVLKKPIEIESLLQVVSECCA